MSILQVLYEFFNWQYFGILSIIWIVINLAWISRWRGLLERIGLLISKPIISQKDNYPNDPRFYPRILLEQLALNRRREKNEASDSKTDNDSTHQNLLVGWSDSLKEKIFDKTKPIRSVGYVIGLTFFIVFIIADAITIAQTLQLLGLTGELSPFFQNLELPFLGGAILSIVVGIWIFFEMISKEGELINTSTYSPPQKKFFKIISGFVIFFAFIVLVGYTLKRLIEMGFLESSTTMEIIIAIILYGLLPLTISCAAGLTFQPAPSGLMVLLFIFIELVISILPIIAFLLDLIWRFCYIVVDIVIWFITTPLILLPHVVMKMFKWG